MIINIGMVDVATDFDGLGILVLQDDCCLLFLFLNEKVFGATKFRFQGSKKVELKSR